MPAETLGTFTVTPDDIAATFKPGPRKNWARYNQMAENWYLREMTAGEAARNEGLSSSRRNPEGRKAYRRFCSSFRLWQPKKDGGKGRKPFPVHAVGALNHFGIFPGIDDYTYDEDGTLDVDALRDFDAHNPRFRAIAWLSTLQLMEGSMTQKANHGSSVGCYFASDQMHDSRMVKFLGAIMDEEVDPKKRQLPVDSYHARLLAVLGNHIGHSNHSLMALPRPIMAALETIQLGVQAESYEKTLAFQILEDFVYCLFGLDKASPRDESYRTIARAHVPSLQTEALAKERAELFIEILAQTEVTKRADYFGPYEDARSGLWSSTLNLEFAGKATQKIPTLNQEFFDRIAETVNDLQF